MSNRKERRSRIGKSDIRRLGLENFYDTVFMQSFQASAFKNLAKLMKLKDAEKSFEEIEKQCDEKLEEIRERIRENETR